jgi:DNA primase
VVTAKVFEKVYLDLQEDEIEFANEDFKDLYFEIINTLNQHQEIKVEKFVNQLQPERAEAVTHILMDDEKYHRHDWESKDIFAPSKKELASKVVSDTLLNLRSFYIKRKIEQLMLSPMENGEFLDKSIMEDVNDYKKLDILLSRKLNRVL